MSEQRYIWANDIDAIVDLAVDRGDGLGEEMTTPDVLVRLNTLQARAEKAETLNAKLLAALRRTLSFVWLQSVITDAEAAIAEAEVK